MLRLFSRRKKVDSLDKDINWNISRYSTVVAQRNILLLITLSLLVAISFSILAIFKISTSSTIEPFVIEINKKSGVVHVVDPITVKQYSANEALNNHFISEYIRTRELFDPYNYYYNYHTWVRVFSSSNVYNNFAHYIRMQNIDNLVRLHSDFVKRDLTIHSIQKLNNDLFQVRFSMEFTEKNNNIKKEKKIAAISYRYAPLEMNDKQRYINPLGFQVISYRVDNDYE